MRLGRALLLSLALLACGDDSAMDSGTSDASDSDSDLADSDLADSDLADSDLADSFGGDSSAPTDGVRCGELVCTGSTFCCTADLGVNGDCGEFPEGCGAGVIPNQCDGPEDCVDVCCFDRSTSCLPADVCSATGTVVCHGSADCGGMPCCPASEGSPWGLCSATPCG